MADLASELVSALELDAKMVDPKAVKLGKPSRKAIGKAKSPRAPKGTKVVLAHPPYLQMVMEAISSLKERSGSSQYAIAKHLEAKYKGVLPVNYKKTLSIQLKKLCVKGKLLKVKSSYKLSEELKKPAKAGKAPGAYKGPKSPGRPKGSKNKAKSVKVPKAPKAPKSPKAPKAMKVAKPVKLAKKPKAAKPGRPPKSPAEKKAPAVKKVVAAKPATKKPTTPKKAAPKKPKSLKAKSPKKGKSPAAKRAKK